MQRTQTTCLILLTVIAVGFSLRFLQTVLLPFVIALFVVIGIRPLLELLQRRFGLNRLVAVGISFVIGLIALTATGMAIWVSIQDIANNSDVYEQRLTAIGNWLNDRLEETPAPTADDAAQETGESSSVPAGEVPENDPVAEDSDVEPDVSASGRDALQNAVAGFSNELESLLLGLVGSMSSLLSYGIMIVLFVFFLLIGQGEANGQRPQILDEIEEQVRRYLVMKTVISIFTGIAFGSVLWFFGVPLAILFGMLAFLLNYIPNIGPLVANVLPIPLLVLNSEISPGSAIVCLILITAVQFISGNVIETRLMGKSFDVSPVVLLLALMFFGLVWGIVGMFLATPLVSILKIVLQHTQSGKPIAELMAGRWTSGTAEA